MAKDAWGNDIDLMIGGCSNETVFMIPLYTSDTYDLELLLKNFKNALPFELNVKFRSEKSIEYGKELMKLYYGCTEPSRANLQGFLDVSRVNSSYKI